MSFKDFLGDRANTYRNSTGDFAQELSEGKYNGEISKVIFKENDLGIWYLRLEVAVLGSSFDGVRHSILYYLAPPKEGKLDKLVFLKRDLSALEIKLEEIENLPNILPKIEGIRLTFEIWKKEGYLNTKILGRLKDGLTEDLQESHQDAPF